MRAFLLAALVLLGSSFARADDGLTVLPRDDKAPPRAMLRSYLMAECQKHFDARRAAVAKLKTPADLEARQKALRAKFIEALGGFPEKTPLKASVVGKIECEGYTVEKVIYESRPGHHVTASFYLPAGKGPFPGVLMPIGHSITGKSADYVQRGCILLAKNGLAALAYDPIGQGERRQLLEGNKPAVPGSTTEHTLVGVGAILIGQGTATYRIWDGIRSLDYLVSRPEVDAKKLGCTGCSGGGTLTSYLMALDDRITAAAPSCYITTLERLFSTIGPQDAEQNITGQVAFGLEHADYLTLRAPKPTLICAATEDFFDIGGTWTSFREAKRLYGLLGQPERVDLLESDSKHSYPRLHREGAVRWMKRWLLGKDEAVRESDWPILKDEELRCTRTGQVLEDLAGISTFGLSLKQARELEARRKTLDRDELAKAVAKRIGVTLPVPAAKRAECGVVKRETHEIRKLVFTTEPGVTLPAILLEPSKAAKAPLVVYVHDEGKSADHAGAIREHVEAGRRVLAVDLRGWGETAPAPTPKKPGHFGVDSREAFLALHLARPLLGQRVHDLLAVLAEVNEDVEAIGVGKGGVVVLHAAALSAKIARVRLERSLVSWMSVVETPLGRDHLTQVVPGALALYDLPDLAVALVPRPLTVVAPVDALGERLSTEKAKQRYAAVQAAYRQREAEKAFDLRAD